MRNEHIHSKTSPKLKAPGAKYTGKRLKYPGNGGNTWENGENTVENGVSFLAEGGI